MKIINKCRLEVGNFINARKSGLCLIDDGNILENKRTDVPVTRYNQQHKGSGSTID